MLIYLLSLDSIFFGPDTMSRVLRIVWQLLYGQEALETVGGNRCSNVYELRTFQLPTF